MKQGDVLFFSYSDDYHEDSKSYLDYGPEDTCLGVRRYADYLGNLISELGDSEFDIVVHSRGGLVAGFCGLGIEHPSTIMFRICVDVLHQTGSY